VSDGPSKRRRRIRAAAAAAAVLVTLTIAGGAAWVHSLGPVPLGETLEFSTVVVDRNGQLLRPYATVDGRWRLPATVADVDLRYLDLLIAYEDKRFRQHHGVDPLAVMRAAFQLVSSGRIVSGGSTITMQVARLLEPRSDRTFLAKLRQAVRALQLEQRLSKDEIFTLYLGLAPYGGNLEGVRAASHAYFGKEPKRLTLGEAALLVAIPQSPEVRRPDRSPRAPSRRVTACSTVWHSPIGYLLTKSCWPKPRQCMAAAGRCRCSRPMPPIRRSAPHKVARSLP